MVLWRSLEWAGAGRLHCCTMNSQIHFTVHLHISRFGGLITSLARPAKISMAASALFRSVFHWDSRRWHISVTASPNKPWAESVRTRVIHVFNHVYIENNAQNLINTIIIISYFSLAYDYRLLSHDQAKNFCFKPYNTKNRKFLNLTALKIDFLDKILVLAWATLWRHNSEINAFTLWSKYLTVILLKRIGFQLIIIKQL